MSKTLEIDINKDDIEKLIKKTSAITAEDTLRRAITAGGLFLSTWIIKNRLTGPRPGNLGVVTGRLRSSIGLFNFLSDKGGISVRIGTNVIYARIHEYGGTIRPGAKGFLAWQNRNTGKWVFTQKPVKIPARPFLRPAIEDQSNITEVTDIVNANIKQAIENA